MLVDNLRMFNNGGFNNMKLINAVKKINIIIWFVCGIGCSFLFGWFFNSLLGTATTQPNKNNNNIFIDDTYNGYNVNGILQYDHVGVLIVNDGTKEAIKEAILEGEIANEYDKVLFKSKNCIPDNQKIKKIK